MTLPLTTYEDTVGARIKLINYERMALELVEIMDLDDATELLRRWGEAIYQLGKDHEDVALIQPLKIVGGD